MPGSSGPPSMWLREEQRGADRIVYASGKYFWVSGVIISSIFAAVFAGGCFQIIQFLQASSKSTQKHHGLFTGFNLFYLAFFVAFFFFAIPAGIRMVRNYLTRRFLELDLKKHSLEFRYVPKVGKPRSYFYRSSDVSSINLRKELWKGYPYWVLELKLNDGQLHSVDSGREENEMNRLTDDLAETLRVTVNKT